MGSSGCFKIGLRPVCVRGEGGWVEEGGSLGVSGPLAGGAGCCAAAGHCTAAPLASHCPPLAVVSGLYF